MRNAFLKGGLMVAISHVAVFGCGGGHDTGDGGITAGRGSGGASGASSKGGFGGTLLPNGGVSGSAASGAGGSIDPDAACVADGVNGSKAVVALYFMVDISGSMNCPVPEISPPCEVDPPMDYMTTRWTETGPALRNFFSSPAVAGMWAGIDFFPEQNNVCDDSEYADPASEIALLPGAAMAINAAIDGVTPAGQTPTVPSITGAVDHARAWATSHDDHQAVVVYVTDGYPRGCNGNSIGAAAQIAAGAFGGTPSIRTYVLGIGPNLTDLNQIAASGGTQQALFINTGQDVGSQLVAALNMIRNEVAVDCTYAIPSPPPGRQINYDQVNVRITDGNGNGMDIFQSADCTSGWQYSPDHTQVILCGTTCDAVQADPGSSLDVLFGCDTVSEPPR